MNPHPRYRKKRVSKDMSDAQKRILENMVETNPAHQQWENETPAFLFVIAVIGVFTAIVAANFFGLDPLSLFVGSVCTVIVIAIIRMLRKRRDKRTGKGET